MIHAGVLVGLWALILAAWNRVGFVGSLEWLYSRITRAVIGKRSTKLLRGQPAGTG